MGYPMAMNFYSKVGKEKTLIINDLNNEACRKFVKEASIYGSVEIVKTASEAVYAANIIFTIMPSNDAVRSLYLDPETGILAAAKGTAKPKLLIECGTIAQSVITEVSDLAKQSTKIDFIDAPMSGGTVGSEAGTLTFMVGCPESLFPRIKSLLIHMGKPESVFHCGDVGSGTAFKIINNYISLISVLSVSEAYNIASRMDLDLQKLTDVLNTGTAHCWVTSKNNPVPGMSPGSAANNEYEGGFRIELAHKDLSLGADLAEMVGARRPLHKAALQVYEEVKADPRYAGKDTGVLYKWLKEDS